MRYSSRSGLPVRAAVLFSATLCTAGSYALNYDVNYTSTPPVVDGAVDSNWGSASPAATNFVVYNNVGTQADQQTQVRMLYDDQKLYVLFEAQDSEIVAPATANHQGFDFGSPQDTAEIFLDPSLSQETSSNDKMYHIAINPSPDVFIYTEAGQNQTAWITGPASEYAFSASGTNWKVEFAVSWTELNSTLTNTPGVVVGPPPSGTLWGVQMGRLHSPGGSSIVASKWHPTSGAFRARPLGTLKFVGPANVPGVDLAGKTDLFSTSFESPTYTAGASANGIEEWSAADPSLFEVSTDYAKTGSQSLKLLAQTPTGTIRNEKKTTNTDTAQYVQYAIRLPAEHNGYSYRHVLYLSGEYTTGGDVAGQLWFQGRPDSGANIINLYSYEDPASNTPTGNNFPGLQAFDEWSYVTVRVDPVAATYEVWINDTKLVRSADGMDAFPVKRASEFVQLTTVALYNKGYGIEPVYVDDFTQALDAVDSGVADWQLF